MDNDAATIKNIPSGAVPRFPLAILLATAAMAAACGGGEEAPAEGEAYIAPSDRQSDLAPGDTIPGHPSWTQQDWEILRETVTWARSEGIDTLPVGERVARIGERFVGAPYVPKTLDPPGPESLVINLRELDCVTFVENMLALALFARNEPDDILQDRDAALESYAELLTGIRYRNGTLHGYPSRLHYFSEWIHDNEQMGFVRDVTREIGGVADDEPIDFMTTHRDAYRQLTELENFEAIEAVEERLSGRTRYYIPQERVAQVQDQIQTGDIIAATSTLEGLDIAHTGVALWQGDTLHLMHAPLVGEDVQISERALGERLLGIDAQDGIMVARPLENEGGE